MRPPILTPLFAGIESLPGIGRKSAELLVKLVGPRVIDSLHHRPNGVIDRRHCPRIADLPLHHSGHIVTLNLHVESHHPPAIPRLPYRVHCRDDSGDIDLIFFRVRGDYLKRLAPPNADIVVSGRLERYKNNWQIPHPDHVLNASDATDLPLLEAVYPLTSGLSRKMLTRAMRGALAKMPDLPEWLDPATIERYRWPGWHKAMTVMHRPGEAQNDQDRERARARLAYDELLAHQLALGLTRQRITHPKGRSTRPDTSLKAGVLGNAGVTPTPGQKEALAQIEESMARPQRMLSLLQGDVGSGKTLVAALAMANVVAAGLQAIIMAPTELLAHQHRETLGHLFSGYADPPLLLTGRDTLSQRRDKLAALVQGRARLAVGTHALFQEEIALDHVGLIVIDEQHRFGVHQRMRLQNLAPQSDILVMTATPIPRTLTLALYGDIPVCRIHGKPPGRRPIDTRVLPLTRMPLVEKALGRKLDSKEQIYWICPVIEDSEEGGAAITRHHMLAERFPGQVGLLHGAMAPADKETTMQAFIEGALKILVATTVIEVGIDVPQATTIIVEHAERFGLAQLHQLRGRVGRGRQAGTCLLLYNQPLSHNARSRLETLRRCDDGFKIAEQDLLLRGGGDVLGTRQSGMPDFKLVDLVTDGHLLEHSSREARHILTTNGELKGTQGDALRLLLHLFERGAAIHRARGG